jgi:hypothetical protein
MRIGGVSPHMLILALDEVEWSPASLPGHFTLGDRSADTLWRGGEVGPRANLDSVEKWKIGANTLHVFCLTWLTYATLPWERNPLLLDRPFLVANYQTTTKFILPVSRRIWAISFRDVASIHYWSLIKLVTPVLEKITSLVLESVLRASICRAGMFRLTVHRTEIDTLLSSKTVNRIQAQTCAHTYTQKAYQRPFFRNQWSQNLKIDYSTIRIPSHIGLCRRCPCR